ncbi:hypothetical protein [Thalassovita sp.]|uniref:hypothetical protein n=1 Tax=Thalassovita sp. TaxID=1979401 RepID=UPI002AB27BF2|nr:hypothetical protein [Thalassovita sp.]
MTKRFDVSLEISKLLILLCSAKLVGVSALTRAILHNGGHPLVTTALVVLYTALALSIFAGILHLGAITRLVETSEHRQHVADAADAAHPWEFVSLGEGTAAQHSALAQKAMFLVAILALILALLVDRNLGGHPTGASQMAAFASDL